MPRSRAYIPMLCSYPDSAKVSALEARWAESLYVRLLCKCDDEGRYYAEPHRLIGALFPHQWKAGRVDLAAVQEALDDLVRVALVRLYEADGEMYLEVLEHFRPVKRGRDRISRYPEPKNGPGDTEDTFVGQRPDNGGQRPPSGAPSTLSTPVHKCPSTPVHKPPTPSGSTPPGGRRRRPGWAKLREEAETWEIPEGFEDVWSEWLDAAGELPRRPTRSALQAHLRKLSGVGLAAARLAVEYAVENSLQGFSAKVLEVSQQRAEQKDTRSGSARQEFNRRMGWADED